MLKEDNEGVLLFLSSNQPKPLQERVTSRGGHSSSLQNQTSFPTSPDPLSLILESC